MELYSYIFFLLFLITIAGETVCANNPHRTHHTMRRYGVKNLFVFGDSYADTGNNPKATTSSWKTPYGITFPGKPSGRYSDGRVFTDYLARFLGLRSPLPNKFRKHEGYKPRYGINFAHGGTGVFDTGSSQPNMTTQIGYLEKLIKDCVYTKHDLNSSVVLVAVSGNDYLAYIAGGGTDQGLPAFITKVVGQMEINLKRIHDLGLKRVLVNGLQPLGCLPRSTMVSSYQKCNDIQNGAVGFHNSLLQKAVTTLNNNTKDSSFHMLDLFTVFNTVIKNKGDSAGTFKFDTPLKPCCAPTSNSTYCGTVDGSGKPLYTVCNEPMSSFFWDESHPTQAGWNAVYLTLMSSLKQIFV